MITIVFSLGFVNFKISTNPQELWVPPTSRANKEQSYFDNNFGPFFRINAMWMVPFNEADEKEDIFLKPYLELAWFLQNAIMTDTIDYYDEQYKLDNFCFKPISGKGCLVTSPLQYWRDDLKKL